MNRICLPPYLFSPGFVLALSLVAASCTAESKTMPEDGRDEASIRLIDVTEQAGLGAFRHENGAVGRKWYPEMMGSGGGFIDYDSDGWLDILLLGGGSWDPDSASHPRGIWLFRNDHDGTFTDQTVTAGLADIRAYTIGLAAADYDNDGDEDFVVSNLHADMFFRNDGGVFTEVAAEAGIGQHREWGSSPIFFDADGDGYLDLFVGNYVDWSEETDKWCPSGSPVKMYCIPADYEGIASRYYHNNGDGTFTDRTAEAGFIVDGRSVKEKALGVIELDFNADGRPDLYVATDGEGNLLYENRGDGTFVERGVLSGVAFSEHGEARAGMGVDAGVVDSSGQVSIFVGNFSEEPISVYRHHGNGLFLDRTAMSRLSQPSFLTLTFGLVLLDVDLDGDLDLFAANGHVYPDRLVDQDKITFEQPAQLYLNHGHGTFEEVQHSRGVLTKRIVARGAASGDFDRDGDLDILITENNGPAHLWRNDAAEGNFLRVRLEGRQTNRDALGSRIEAVVDGYRMVRWTRTGSSYLSQSEKTASFGLGGASRVDSLLIFWRNGRIDRFSGVEANQEIKIVEGDGVVEPVPMAGARTGQLANSAVPNP